jgi:spore coat polysaccharide biosynthesis protein SpsF
MSINIYNALLTVRTLSTRLPKKCFLPFGESNILNHVVRRAVNSGINPIICTSNDKSDDGIEDFCQENNLQYFRGSLKNKLDRWLSCASNYNLLDFHTVDVDDPFFDPRQVKESIDLLREKNLDIVHPSKISSNGAASVGYSIKSECLNKNKTIINRIDHIEMIDSILSQFKDLNQEVLESRFSDFLNIRLTLDYIEDYNLLTFVLQELGPDCNRIEIGELFSRNPDLYKMNWFRNLDWSSNQNLIRSKQGSI